VIVVGLSSLTYQATEGPSAVASVCATIEVAAGPVSRDMVVYLITPVTGSTITGKRYTVGLNSIFVMDGYCCNISQITVVA
jgi:hypothetical protein